MRIKTFNLIGHAFPGGRGRTSSLGESNGEEQEQKDENGS